MAYTPTIVTASLDDKELQESINNMVTNFDKGLQKMSELSNTYVDKIQKKLQEIGNSKFGDGGSADGGSTSKQVKAQDEVTEAVKRTTKARKEDKLTFDQLVEGLQKAQGVVRNFNINREGNLPSSKDYKEYEQALARIVEYNDKLKQSALSRADANQWAFAFDGKRVVNDLTAVDERLKQLNKYYAEQEKASQKVSQANEKENQKRLAAIEKESAAQKKMIDEQYKLSFARTAKIPTDQIDIAQAKLERLQALLREMRERGILNPTQIASTEAEIRKLEQMIGQIGQTQQQTTKSAQRYTEEIIRQAQAIRESEEFKNTGSYGIIADKERNKFAWVEANDRRSIEEQLLAIYNEEKGAVSQIVMEENHSKDTSKERLGTEQAITQEIEKRKKYVSPTVNDDYYQLTQVAIANKLGISQSKVINADAQFDSIKRVSESLKQMQDAYIRMTNEERKSPIGKHMLQQMQELEKQLQQLRKEMSRPINLDAAMAGTPRTIDEITEKIHRLQQYRNSLNFTDPKQAAELKTVDAELNKLQKDLNKYMGSARQASEVNNALSRSWNYMKNRLAFYFTVGASTQFVKNLIQVRSEYEMNERALGILLDSASRGTRIFNELSQMSLVSPYTLIELSSAAKQLTAYDIAAKDVVDTTRRLADMASAVGIPVERLTYALGQIKAYGYLNSRDARMFANAGIPLVKQLADHYTELEGKMVSTADVYDRMKKKAIDYNDVMQVVTKMTDEGGKFFDFQAKMADTLKVRLANLTLAWNNMLNDMGKAHGGILNGGIRSITILLRHWRDINRVIYTVIVALGAYKTATIIAGMTTRTSIGGSAITSWLSLARGVKSTKDAVALFSLTVKSIPFAGWITAIASLVSWFVLFNNSGDDVKQKLEEIKNAFDGVRKEIVDLYADAIKSDSIGTQLTKLRDILELAQTELGVTIPIRLEDVNESNIKQKLKEVKNTIDNYLDFSQTFSEAAVGTKFNELMNDFGATARSTYTTVSESINTVIVALQELSNKGQASKRDIEILNELTAGQKEDESRIEYLQRLVSIYEELGLIGEKVTTPMIGKNFFLAYFKSTTDNMDELEKNQENTLDRLGIKNREVYANMLKDVQDYYSSSAIAAYQLEEQVKRVAEKIDINNIPVEQRTMKLSAAINEEASLNNWNQFEKEFARQVANKKFGTNIEISDNSKKDAEADLQQWQKDMQSWADKNGIKMKLTFQTNDTEESYAKRMLQAAKDAKEEWETLERKVKVGTGTKDAANAAKEAYEEARKIAQAAGADIESLDKKSNAAAKRAAKAAETELQKALKDELQLLDKVRSQYKKLTDAGVDSGTALSMVTNQFNNSITHINKILGKNGLPLFDIKAFAGTDDPNKMLEVLDAQLKAAKNAKNIKPSEIKDLEIKIGELKIDAKVYNTKKITEGLNNELGKLKDEYELAIELDANPELGGMFMDLFDIDQNSLPHSIDEYANRILRELNASFKKRGIVLELPTLNLTNDDLKAFREQLNNGTLDKITYDAIVNNYEKIYQLRKKSATDISKMIDDYVMKYGDLQAQIEKIEMEKNNALLELNSLYNTDALRQTKEYLDAKETIENAARIKEAKASYDYLKKTDDYERFFTRINTLTTKDAAAIKAKIKQGIIQAFKGGGLTVNEFTKELKSLEKQFDELTKSSSGWVNYLDGGFNQLIERAKETGQEVETIGEKMKIQGSIDEKDKNFLQSLGNIFNNRQGGKTDFTSLMSSFGNNMQGLGDAVSQAGQGMQTGASGFAGAITIVDTIIKNVHQTVQAIGSVIDELDSVRNEENKISNAYIEGFKKFDNYAYSGWENLKSGNIAGAVADTANSIISIFNTSANAYNEKINKQIKESEREVKRLENTYKSLKNTVNNTYGAITSGAHSAVISNKQLQLVELERQLQLEKSRKKKNQDKDKIIELEGQIIDLRNEINNATQDIVNDLLGISSAGDGIESIVEAMIEAFRKGEDAMKAFSDKWDEMIDNMILKYVVSSVFQTWWDGVMADLKKKEEDYLKEASDEQAAAQQEADRISTVSDNDIKNEMIREWIRQNPAPQTEKNDWETRMAYAIEKQKYADSLDQASIDAYRKATQDALNTATDNVNQASIEFTKQSIDYLKGKGKEFKDTYADALNKVFGEWYTYGEKAELSALQQGIQGITEDTAGALEAYMNGVSQQVYLQSDLLTQIRDAVVEFDGNATLATQAQMLLQLQQSYQVQQSIENILQGALVPSGRAFAVELIS